MDRNLSVAILISGSMRSLSARLSLIHISCVAGLPLLPDVALRKESVDRNPMTPFRQEPATVALRKESVDRNMSREMSLIRPYGRSPQGERG